MGINITEQDISLLTEVKEKHALKLQLYAALERLKEYEKQIEELKQQSLKI